MKTIDELKEPKKRYKVIYNDDQIKDEIIVCDYINTINESLLGFYMYNEGLLVAILTDDIKRIEKINKTEVTKDE